LIFKNNSNKTARVVPGGSMYSCSQLISKLPVCVIA
jgi:hypothetical protein